MGNSRLSGRLARIRETKKQTSADILPEGIPDPSPKALIKKNPASNMPIHVSGQCLPGWRLIANDLYERVSVVDIPGSRRDFSTHLPLLFPREKADLSLLKHNPDALTSLVFFDLETTGLSHGAGTVAFMAGIARFTGTKNNSGQLEIRQILLGDYPGECAFLSRFIELVGNNPFFVSFNGKCFDSQILSTRFSMNGFRPGFMTAPAPHLDLLFPSRKLWKKRLGSCRLSILEEHILGVERINDLPGSEAPEAWFEFLRSGNSERLLAIGDHNRDDCASLARLLFVLDDAIEQAVDRAALIRAMKLRADGEYHTAAQMLEPLADLGDILALKLLAIDFEHRIKDLERAMIYAERLGDESRLRRLHTKMDRRDR